MKINNVLIALILISLTVFSVNCGQTSRSGSQTVTFTVSPMASSDYRAIGPMGSLNPRMGHAFPTDHGGFSFKDPENPSAFYTVRAPASGTITKITYTVNDWPSESGQSGTYEDWIVDIEHTADLKSRFGHMSSLDDAIKAQAGNLQPNVENTVSIPVSAGTTIGTSGGRPKVVYGMDWFIIDNNVSLDFIKPERYGRTIHAAHFLDYCSDSLKAQYTPMIFNPDAIPIVTREVEPLGGKINYDQLGKLVGNWFHNTVNPGEEGIFDYDKQLAFVYDEFDPTKIRVTSGGPTGEVGTTPSTPLGIYVTTYQVVNNTPDPVSVALLSGEVVYHLKGLEINGETTIEATLLLKLTGTETLSIEGYTGYVTSPAFSTNVQTYIR